MKRGNKYKESAAKLEIGKLYEVEEGDIVSVSANNCNIKLKVIIDNQISGNIAYIPTFDKKIETNRLFGSYRFNQATISKV